VVESGRDLVLEVLNQFYRMNELIIVSLKEIMFLTGEFSVIHVLPP
jgi:hypothetical protein